MKHFKLDLMTVLLLVVALGVAGSMVAQASVKADAKAATVVAQVSR